MAVKFETTGGNDHYEAPSTTITATPFTIDCWFKPDATAAFQTLASLGHESTGSHFFTLGTDNSNPPVARITRRAGGGTQAAVSTSATTAGQWHHLCAVFATTSSMTIYLDGANSTENTSLVIPTVDVVTIGAVVSGGTPLNFADGTIAYATLRDVALTALEVAELASGKHAYLVRPSSIRLFFPLRGDGPVGVRVRDMVGGENLETVGGTPTKTDSPKLRVGRFF